MEMILAQPSGRIVSVTTRDDLEDFLGRPVVDKTDLTGTYDLKLEWQPDADQVAMFQANAAMSAHNTVDMTTGTIQLKAIFPNDDEGLWPGEFVNAWLLVDTIRNGVTLPVPAVQHGPNGLFVYVVDPNGIARRQNVEVSYQDGGTAVISNGLRGGENVVLSGQSRLSPGTPVAVQASSGSGSQAPAGPSQ